MRHFPYFFLSFHLSLSLFDLICSSPCLLLIVPLFLLLTDSHAHFQEHPNNSSQVEFCCVIYSWLHVSWTLLFLLLVSFFEM